MSKSRITKAVQTGAFFHNELLVNACRTAARLSRTLHIWGLLSDGSVHSHIDHLLALLDLAGRENVKDIALHAVLDGRDKPPRSALAFIERTEMKLKELACGRIATVSGRYFAMDRDRRWERVERVWRAIVMAEGPTAPSARAAVEASYADAKTDEFVEPTVIGEARPMADGDQVICFNFRADRARELTSAMAQADFTGFARPRAPKIGYVCMSEYDRSLNLSVAFAPEEVRNMLVEVFAREKIHNLRIAETEKYAHVTYFLNGGVEQAFPCEERILIPSSRVATYDLEPEMQAIAIARRAAEGIASGHFGVVIMNFANPDMVGHTGDLNATIKAVEASDQALGIVLDAVGRAHGAALITADHGKAELMVDLTTGQPHTAHTTNPVPFILYDPASKGRLISRGSLADVAPTLLGLLRIPVPAEMTGHDLRIPWM